MPVRIDQAVDIVNSCSLSRCHRGILANRSQCYRWTLRFSTKLYAVFGP